MIEPLTLLLCHLDTLIVPTIIGCTVRRDGRALLELRADGPISRDGGTLAFTNQYGAHTVDLASAEPAIRDLRADSRLARRAWLHGGELWAWRPATSDQPAALVAITPDGSEPGSSWRRYGEEVGTVREVWAAQDLPPTFAATPPHVEIRDDLWVLVSRAGLAWGRGGELWGARQFSGMLRGFVRHGDRWLVALERRLLALDLRGGGVVAQHDLAMGTELGGVASTAEGLWTVTVEGSYPWTARLHPVEAETLVPGPPHAAFGTRQLSSAKVHLHTDVQGSLWIGGVDQPPWVLPAAGVDMESTDDRIVIGAEPPSPLPVPEADWYDAEVGDSGTLAHPRFATEGQRASLARYLLLHLSEPQRIEALLDEHPTAFAPWADAVATWPAARLERLSGLWTRAIWRIGAGISAPEAVAARIADDLEAGADTAASLRVGLLLACRSEAAIGALTALRARFGNRIAHEPSWIWVTDDGVELGCGAVEWRAAKTGDAIALDRVWSGGPWPGCQDPPKALTEIPWAEGIDPIHAPLFPLPVAYCHCEVCDAWMHDHMPFAVEDGRLRPLWDGHTSCPGGGTEAWDGEAIALSSLAREAAPPRSEAEARWRQLIQTHTSSEARKALGEQYDRAWGRRLYERVEHVVRVGGAPHWVQHPDGASCACGEMIYLAEVRAFAFGCGDQTLFVFGCGPCMRVEFVMQMT